MKKLLYIYLLIPCISFAQVQFKSPEFELGIRRHLNLNISSTINLNSMDTIRKLDLSGLNIRDVNDAIFLKKIRNLNLSNNQIKDISPLQSLPHLQVLNVSNNSIKNISTFTFSDKRNFKLIVTGNEITDFQYLSPKTFANIETVGVERQIGEEPNFLLNNLFTTTRTNGQAKIYYNVWDNANNCVPFSLAYGDSNTNNSLQCNSYTNNLDYDYTNEGFKTITITRDNKTLTTHFVAPYNLTFDMGQSYPINLSLLSEINLISLENMAALGTASLSSNQINYEPLAVGNDIIKVKYKYGTSNRTEVFYIFTTNTNILSTDEVILLNGVKIYPNPTKNILHIEIKNDNLQSFQLTDIQGRIIKQENISGNSYKLNLEDLPQAVYILEITFGNSKQSVKVVKK